MQTIDSALHLAIDLGAGSGRAILGWLGAGRVELSEVHRFYYPTRREAAHLRWPFSAILDGIRTGLQRAGEAARPLKAKVATVGVDSWAVDYGLVDRVGRLLEEPICYRDDRTAGVMEQVEALVPRAEIFARTGIQFLPFNTLYQVFAHAREGLPEGCDRLLMIPDLCHQWLCGSGSGEYTNATSTQLLNARTRTWDDDLIGRLRLPRHLFPALVKPGAELGQLRTALQVETGLSGAVVRAPASHDTASAVAGTPLDDGWAYVSSGTWSLVGLERNDPLLTPEAQNAGVTNEGGVFGTFRLLKNVMGLWILDSCCREWSAGSGDYAALVAEVEEIRDFPGFIYPDDPRFFNPARMTAEVEGSLRDTGQPVPASRAALAKVILDSLALRYASVLRTLEWLTGESIAGIHVVGGGSRNRYLNRATAACVGKAVRVGPVEATALGNILIQAIAAGEVSSLREGRRLVAREVSEIVPQDEPGWVKAAARYAEIEARFKSTRM